MLSTLNLVPFTAVPLTLRDMEWDPSPETVYRMAVFCSSTTAPALSYYRPSMDICIALISYI